MAAEFLEEVSRRSGQRFEGCYHCLSCGGGCPVVEAMDYNPNQIIRMVQRGMREEVLGSKAIWVCVGCFSCLSQCPNRVHIPAMMDTLREMALGARRLLSADIGLADTGIAGPGGGTSAKPVGLFYLGLATPAGTAVQELRLEGDRRQNREATALAALALLVGYLERGQLGIGTLE